MKHVQPNRSLAELHPKLAVEWHPTRNGLLTPREFTPGSNKRVWWRCPSRPEHEWQATIASRVAGNGCPMCAGRVPTALTSLRALHPALAVEWHPTKNGELTPDDVTSGSGKKVWWRCPMDARHEWKSAVLHRVNGTGCPVCANRLVTPENSLAQLMPEFAREWHPVKNAGVTPNDVTPGSHMKVWWQCAA